jgi:hypothetical protein
MKQASSDSLLNTEYHNVKLRYREGATINVVAILRSYQKTALRYSLSAALATFGAKIATKSDKMGTYSAH